jgi:hypothetical protein
VGAVGKHFGFGYGWWRQCGWRQFKGWLRELRADQERQALAHKTSPDTWAGAEHDGWWAQARAKGKR